MKPLRVFLLLALVAGTARAEVIWSDWSPIKDPWHPDRQGHLEIRVREDTNGGQGYGENGHMMWYQVRNTNSQWGASIPMIFPRRNKEKRQWEEAKGDLNFGSYIKPGEFIESWQNAETSSLHYTYSIRWEDDPPEEKKSAKDPANGSQSDPADVPGRKLPEANEPEPQPTRDLPEDDVEVLSGKVGREPDQEFQAVVTFNKPAGWQDSPPDRDEWKEEFISYIRSGYRFYSYAIIEASKDAVTINFTSISGADLARILAITDQAQVSVQNVRRLSTKHQPPGAVSGDGGGGRPKYQENGPIDPNAPVKIIPASQPSRPPAAPTPGKERFYPYWFDPSDESAEKSTYYIYVRINGEARRMPLREAQLMWNVPMSATRYTMTNYNEKKKKIESDLGTHRDKP
jgi:hypothetical protein